MSLDIKMIASIENISFNYYRMPTGKNSMKRKIFHPGSPLYIETPALSNISLAISRGTSIGLIGTNGSGKSTLLKVIAGIYSPTTGSVRHWGRVNPLVDLGSGFHPELSVERNIELNAQILGVTSIDARTVVKTAKLNVPMDTPVRTFSTGMLARLSFAIATYEDSDLLLIDEVLSVGDAGFKESSKNRLKNLVDNGNSFILVSHDLTTITDLCETLIWLEFGQIKEIGKTQYVINKYLSR